MEVIQLIPMALASFVVSGQAQAGADEDFDSIARPFLDRHCVRCHGDASAESHFLDLVSPVAVGSAVKPNGESVGGETSAQGVGADIDWEWLLERVEFGDMPPPGEAAPDDAERDAFVHWLSATLDSGEDQGAMPLPPSALRRLTALEYRNAVQVLLGVSFPAARFLPEDAVGHGFDHVGSAQSLSEAHFVQYLQAAEAVAERALPRVLLEPGSRHHRFAVEDLEGGRPDARGRVLATNGAVQAAVTLPSSGRYRVRAEVYGMQAGPDPCRARLSIGDLAFERDFEVAAEQDSPMVIEADFMLEHGAATHVSARFLNDYFRKAEEGKRSEDRNFVVRWIEVEGPMEGSAGPAFTTPFMDRWGIAPAGGREPEGAPSTEERIAACAALVWRRSHVPGARVERLMALTSEDASPGDRMRASLIAMLASPRFLFLMDRSVEGTAEDARGSVPLDGNSLGARLAAFLWRSVPDADLLERMSASADPVLMAEEMLLDPRSDAFADSFADQWLQLRGTRSKRASRKSLPAYSDRLRDSMLEETQRVFRASLREEWSLWEFIEGTETIVDGRLAEHYGLTPEAFAPLDGGVGRLPANGEWRRASLVTTSRRGLLGHGSILFGTSEATRTSPVKRGKWVLEVLLGSAPPPPPPGVGNLAPAEEETAKLTFRERFAAHRADPTCASCHARMDPIGFGLERFDALGAERATGDPILDDLSGALPDGREFDGPVELAAILRAEDRYLEATAERLLVFALGRGLERSDRAAIRKVLGSIDPEHPTMKSMILAVVALDEFQRMAAPTPGPPTLRVPDDRAVDDGSAELERDGE